METEEHAVRIKILHIHSPHLMWVEFYGDKNQKCKWRQIGLFGVVPPQHAEIDGTVVSTFGSSWDPTVNDAIMQFAARKDKLYFKIIYSDDDDSTGTSIFHNSPHLFGEISGKKNNSIRQLSSSLQGKGMACSSKKMFFQMLTSNNLQTQLNENEMENVIQKIFEHYQKKGHWLKNKEYLYACLRPRHVNILKKLEAQPTMEIIELLQRKMISNQPRMEKLKDSSRKHKESPKIGVTNDRSENYQLIKDGYFDREPPIPKCSDFGNDSVMSPVRYVEDAQKKNMGGETMQGTKKHKERDDMPKLKNYLKMTPSESGTQVSEKITVYHDEIYGYDSEGEINVTDSSHSGANYQKTRGRANSRMFPSPNNRPKLDPYEEEKKFQNLIKLKDLAKQRSKERVDSQESQNVRVDSLNGKVKCGGRQDWMEHTPRRLKDRQMQSQISEENAQTDSNGSNTIKEEAANDNLIAYGPPMCDWSKYVAKKVPNQAANHIPAKNYEDIESTWTEKNVDSEEEAVEANKSLQNYTNKKKIKAHTIDSNDFRNKGQINCNKKDNCLKKITVKQQSVTKENINIDSDHKENKTEEKQNNKSKLMSILRKRKVHESNNSYSSTNDSKSQIEWEHTFNDTSSNEINTISSSKDVVDSDDDDLAEIQAKLSDYKPLIIEQKPKNVTVLKYEAKIHVNPFKNLDGSQSVFVENLVAPLLLAHTKNENIIKPRSNLRDIPFKREIHATLQNMQVKAPSRLQSVSWAYILRGHSVFMIGAPGCGKTLGYLPAVCNLVMDYNFHITGRGPICVIICATAQSVASVAKASKMFLNRERVVTCYPGMDSASVITDLLNGCDILVSTPTMLYGMLGVELGLDLRRLTTVVFDDCERLSEVYESEVKAVQLHVKRMLKTRADKKIKVQYVLASRLWCSFMDKLAKKAPDTIVTFVNFQECVPYSKTNTTVSFVKNNKVKAVVEFLKETDDSKLTVIVCRADDEVDLLESTLKKLNYTVVACNDQMTLHDVYKIRTEGFSNSILICCDGNLSMLNVTDANYLVHFSMPALYSQFCARFSVLNDNYPSIFGPANDNVKIKILLEETNVEQLPKILAFVKRCAGEVPALDAISRKVLEQKDLLKAQRLVPICESLMTFGMCVDEQSHCQERHAILGQYDSPKDWVPYYGYITFKITHYHSAVSYSARLLTHEGQNGAIKYPDYYHKLSMNLGIYFGNEQNKRLHGDPKIGDICAVFVRESFVTRCQVLKIMSGEKDKAKKVLVMMLDEEKLEVVRAVELYHLPEEFKAVETYIVKVRLANIQPQDKDLTFPEHAQHKLEKITDGNDKLYLRSRVIMTVGNSIFVDSLVACENLSDSKTVVKEDFKELLLETLAIQNPDHVLKLKKLCEIGNFPIRKEPQVKTRKTVKKYTEHRWAHLEKNDWSEVVFSNTVNAGKFYVRLQKFEKCINLLISDIKNYINDNPKPAESVSVGDIVLAEFPDDAVYERAIIEEVIDDTKAVCFFVDNADWREVSTKKLKSIPDQFIKQIPFQAIECRLIGVKPPGKNWPEFSSNWLQDNCLENDKGDLKRLYVKYFTKEKAEGARYKYGVVLVDTTTEEDLVINKRMLEMNLAAIYDSEYEYLEKPLDFTRVKSDTSSVDDQSDLELGNLSKNANDLKSDINKPDRKRDSKGLIPIPIKLLQKRDGEINNISDIPIQKHEDETKTKIDAYNDDEIKNNVIVQYKDNNHTIESGEDVPRRSLFPGKLLRSVPLVSDSDEDSDKWDVCFDDSFKQCFGLSSVPQPNVNSNTNEDKSYEILNTVTRTLPAIDDTKNENNTEEPPVKSEDKTSNENSHDYPKIVDIREDVQREMLKNETFSDSDSTLSISDSEDIEEVKTKVSSILDSDDILSGSTDKNDKERSVLDSDDTSVVTDIKSDLTSDITEVTSVDPVKNKCININIDEKSTMVNSESLEIKNVPHKDSCIADVKVADSLGANSVPKSADKDQNIKIINETVKTVEDESVMQVKSKTVTVTESTEPARKPHLTWKQDRHFVTIKIKLVGVEIYTIETTGNRSLKFEAYQNEVRYAFDIELYGIIENGCTHANKGQYIVVTIRKMKTKSPTWLKLAKGSYKNWIVYDVDSIDNDSSSDDDTSNELARKLILDSHEKAIEADRDEMDDDIPDDTGFKFRDDD